jgi:hypothetical protein
VIFTVNAWLLGSQLSVAIPFGTCFSVALAVVVLVTGVAGVGVGGGVGAVAEPPQAARSQTMTILSKVRLDTVRFINTNTFLSITTTFTMPQIKQCIDILQRLTLLQ